MRLLACTVTKRPPDVCQPSIEQALKTCPECVFLLVTIGRDPREYCSTPFFSDKRIAIVNIPVNVGHPGGINFAMMHAFSKGYDFFLLLDDDIAFLTTDWYQKCMDLMAFDERIGVIGPKLLKADLQTIEFAYIHMAAEGIQNYRGAPKDQAGVDRIVRVIAVPTAFFFVRVSHMRKVGFFDLLFSPTQWEDFDYCLRMWRLGFSCVCNGHIEIVHVASTRDDDPVRRLHYLTHLRAMELKYGPVHQYLLKLEEEIENMGREIVLPDTEPPTDSPALRPMDKHS